MKKNLLTLLVFSLCFSYSLLGQQPKGQVRIIGTQLNPSGISSNGEYVTGFVGQGEGGASFIWTEEDGVKKIAENYPTSEAYSISNDGLTLAGLFPDSAYMMKQMNYDTGEWEVVPVLSAGYYKDGKWHSLGINPDLEPDGEGYYYQEAASQAYSISADGTQIAGCWSTGYTGIKPVIWTNGVANVLNYEAKGQGAKAVGISADGTIKAGWAAPVGVRIPVIWKNNDNIKYITPNNGRVILGEANGVSPNGKYVVLRIIDDAAIYDVEKNELIVIGKLHESSQGNPQAVSDDGVVVGFFRDLEAREDVGFIYHEKFGILKVDEYLEKQNIEISDPINWQQIKAISADGKRFIGFGYKEAEMVGFVIDIDEQLTGLNPARNLEIKENGYGNFTLSWKEVHEDSSNTFTGYNIYRNGTKVNATPVTNSTYNDNGLADGTYTYTVKAVWNGTQESLPTAEYTINSKKTILPFFDDFNDRSINIKGWNIEFGSFSGWESSKSGYPPNSIIFNSPLLGEYSEYISTPYIDAAGSDKVYLSFSYQPAGSEIEDNDFLKIEVYNGTIWNTVKQYTASTQPRWDFIFDKIDISEYAANKQIRVRFTAYGDNKSEFGPAWVIDNVKVYDAKDEIVVAAPLNLTARRANEYVYLSWTDPNESAYLTYLDAESLFDYFGNFGESFIAANYYDTEDLKNIEGYTIRSISAYLTNAVPTSHPTYKLVAFKGTEKVLEQTIDSDSYNTNSWNTFDLETPLKIDASQPLYYGIEVSDYDAQDYPLGLSVYPPVDGGANWISDDNGETWKLLSTDFMIGSNWLIKAWMTKEGAPENTKPVEGLYGYMLFRNGEVVYGQDGNGGDMTLYNVFIDSQAPQDEEVCYEVMAVYLNGEESENSEKVCVDGVGIEDNSMESTLEIFPNPVHNELNITGEFNNFSIIDMRGITLLSSTENKVNVSNIPAGIYLIKIETNTGIITQKLIKE